MRDADDTPAGTRPIQSITRAVAILEIIAREGGAASLKEIADRTGLGKTTAHNILRTLGELGYVRRRVGDTRYHLGGRILNLSRMAGDDSALRNRLRPALEAIAHKSGETVYLAVPSALRLVLAGLAVSLAALPFTASQLVPMLGNMFVCGIFAFATAPIVQAGVVAVAQAEAPDAVGTASGFNIAAFNLGIAAASFVGGRLVAGPGLLVTPWAALAAAIVAFGMAHAMGRASRPAASA
ncbi:helix-turn-helix domain-containing protein [Aureimonas frigidaquae]|uniref:Putative HTH-type transcriptional regulator YagI n=1 Tax=Aureimonas frigidaquae TaxID=424757 RepID=A0A0P0Z2D4_9HYPH|nr:helix-turn-helix domain-containing protein [Aureimonas frigidaquae]BAT28246.1 putative HTH-type transcriptional regulator YagI [Aureimonas frigidaquae]